MTLSHYIILLGAFFLYSLTSVFTKLASGCSFMSWGYIGYLASAVVVLGIFAIMWQQIIKKMPISDAYMFKGLTVIFVLILSHCLFGEAVTVGNMIGAAMIVGGIALFAKS